MTRFLRRFTRLPWALLLAALLAAPPARAQLGLDLAAPAEKDKKAKKKGDAKKQKAQEKKSTKKPARPVPRREEPPPAPVPAPEAAPQPEQKVERAPEPPRPQPEPARPAQREPQQVPGLTLTPEVKATPAQKARLDSAKKLLDERATETAALAFDQILRERGLEPIQDEARYQRAKALARLDLRYSALASFDEILERGPAATRFYQSAMEWLFYVGRGLANEQPLMSRVARYAGRGVPPAYEDRVSYLLSKYEFERGRALADAGRTADAKAAFAEARRLAAKVGTHGSAAPPPSSGKDVPGQDTGDVVARARFVDGLIQYAQGDDQGASETFKDVVRLTNPKKVAHADQDLRELTFLQLARIHYQNRQNRYAIFYYQRMPWGGERWLEGLWEASWAYYRIGDYEKSLGNLLTLQSPYFKDEYFPESYVLKAIVYYENCRYPEARRVLEQFSSIYAPVYDELVKITTAQRTPDGWYELVRGAATHPASATARKVLKAAFSDQDVRRLTESVTEMEGEVDSGLGKRRPEFRQSSLGKELVAKLRASRASAVEELGARTRAKLELERDGLRQLLAQALRIQIEVSRKEREALEGSLAKGSQVDVVKNLKYSHAVSDEHLYWPYEGEFWRDELGTYSYTLTKGCKDRLPRPRTAAR
jgi:tetratricopeptide (TPR) repeat protein